MLAAFGLLAVVLATGCVRAAAPRGWAQPAQFGNAIIVTTHTGKLDGIDPTTGDRLWRFPDDWTITDKAAQKLQGIYGKPQVVGDTVYIGDYNGFVYAFKPSEASTDKNERKQAATLN
ncbi:MAG TPA: PQQ-binding-like beta-propeller repeat protein, partial [Dehalococcoidia bacterium]